MFFVQIVVVIGVRQQNRVNERQDYAARRGNVLESGTRKNNFETPRP